MVFFFFALSCWEKRELAIIEGAQCHSGSVLDLRLKGCSFESHRCHCIVSLSKTL